MAKVNWRAASNRRVIGDWVEIKSLEGIDARIKPRKYSQAGADEINAWAVQRQARMKRESVKALIEKKDDVSVRDDAVLDVLANADPELLKQAHYMGLILKHGVHEYEFGDEAGAPDSEWIEAVLNDIELAGEILGIVRGFNSPLARPTSGTSETSQDGPSKE